MLKSLLVPLLVFASVLPAFAGGPQLAQTVTTTTAEAGPFAKGAHEIALTGGFFYSPVIATGGRPVLNYGQGDVSFGWMLTNPAPLFGHSCLRGNWEVLGNLFGAGVVKGSGGFMTGGRLLLRYNFVQPQARWVPFVQIGAGGLGDNIYQHRDQRVVGSGFEFTLVADAGVRYFITPQWAAIVTADFEHVSNAGTAARNLGINASGGMLGVGWFF